MVVQFVTPTSRRPARRIRRTTTRPATTQVGRGQIQDHLFITHHAFPRRSEADYRHRRHHSAGKAASGSGCSSSPTRSIIPATTQATTTRSRSSSTVDPARSAPPRHRGTQADRSMKMAFWLRRSLVDMNPNLARRHRPGSSIPRPGYRAPGLEREQFGVQQDIQSVGNFIRLWTTRNERWPSRIPGRKLRDDTCRGTLGPAGEEGISRWHCVISSVLNFQTIVSRPGNEHRTRFFCRRTPRPRRI